MSDGHWDYRHGSAADHYESIFGTGYIDEVVEDVKSELLSKERGDFTNCTGDDFIDIHLALDYLDSVKDAFDRLYSGDIGADTLVYRVNKAMSRGDTKP